MTVFEQASRPVRRREPVERGQDPPRLPVRRRPGAAHRPGGARRRARLPGPGGAAHRDGPRRFHQPRPTTTTSSTATRWCGPTRSAPTSTTWRRWWPRPRRRAGTSSTCRGCRSQRLDLRRARGARRPRRRRRRLPGARAVGRHDRRRRRVRGRAGGRAQGRGAASTTASPRSSPTTGRPVAGPCTPAGARHGPFDAVVNALWEGRPVIDETVGHRPDTAQQHRYRVSVFARTSRPLDTPCAVLERRALR